MQTSTAGLELIKKFEGFSGVPYYCPAGKLTIGYGHVIITREKIPSEISEIQAENLLKQDVAIVEEAINRLVVVELQQEQFDALVSFVYNIGRKAFEKSTLLRLLNKNKLELAAGEFFRWVFAGGIMQKGLVKRREAEKELFVNSYDGSIK